MFWGSGITRMSSWGGRLMFATEMSTVITMQNSALENMGITLFTKESKIADPHLVCLSLLLCRWLWRPMLLCSILGCSRVTLEAPDKTLLHDSSTSEYAVNQQERKKITKEISLQLLHSCFFKTAMQFKWRHWLCLSQSDFKMNSNNTEKKHFLSNKSDFAITGINSI